MKQIFPLMLWMCSSSRCSCGHQCCGAAKECTLPGFTCLVSPSVIQALIHRAVKRVIHLCLKINTVCVRPETLGQKGCWFLEESAHTANPSLTARCFSSDKQIFQSYCTFTVTLLTLAGSLFSFLKCLRVCCNLFSL